MSIIGAHTVIYSRDADADRAFFRDALGFPAVDAGHGWLIFALPASEAAFHPAERNGGQLYLMCDDIRVETARLGDLGVTCGAIQDLRWGLVTTVPLPGGGEIGLYEPRHALAHAASPDRLKPV